MTNYTSIRPRPKDYWINHYGVSATEPQSSGMSILIQSLPLYPSNLLVVELNLTIPDAGEPGLCAVVPTGNCIAPVVELPTVPDVITSPVTSTPVSVVWNFVEPL